VWEVSTKLFVMLKIRFLIASISCGIGFGITFLISQNLHYAVWPGLSTIFAVVASMTILSSSRQNKVDDTQEPDLTLQNIDAEISQYSDTNKQLEFEIANLQKKYQGLQTKVGTEEVSPTEIKQEIYQLKEQRDRLSIDVNDLDKSLEQKQALLQELDLEIDDRQHTREIPQSIQVQPSGNHNLEILVAPEFTDRTESVEFDSLEPMLGDQLPTVIIAEVAEQWHVDFENNPHLVILKHIDKHGAITESEASSILGNPRSVRQFANSLREYYQYLPFSIKVESSGSGSRYVKQANN
jgi:hypothetical protein